MTTDGYLIRQRCCTSRWNSPSVEEFERQATKIVNAVVAIDADILGLVELENDDDIAIADLVARVNDRLGADVYDFIATGDVGGDAITTGIIYKSDAVSVTGDAAILTGFEGRDFVDPLGTGSGQNRPAVAQTFTDLESGELITVAVNHLKSKGSLTGAPEDVAQGDGQGNNNATRAEAASILADWLASDPTVQGAANQLILGDLNSYAEEDSIAALEAAGFTNIAGEVLGEDSLSFVFDGQGGTLDYALANEALLDDLAGVTEWSVNADEADAIDYNLDFDRDPSLFDGDSAARNSDHDPVIVSFDFEAEEPELIAIAGDAGRDVLTGTETDEQFNASGGFDFVTSGGGADQLVFTDIEGQRDVLTISDYDLEADTLDLGGATVANTVETPARTVLVLDGDDGDAIVLLGVGESPFDDAGSPFNDIA